MRKLISFIIVIIIIFTAGMLTSYYWFQKSSYSTTKEKNNKKILYWVAPMDPNYRRDKPGKSPMGMDLMPVYAGENKHGKGVVKISPSVVNNLGVKTAIVKRRNLYRIINTVGYVTVDENNIEHIHTYTKGWIKKLYVKTTGEFVDNNQPLLELYSPSLNNAQQELLLAIKKNKPSLIHAGEKKLLTLGMSQKQINQIKKSRQIMQRVKIYATKAGIVSKLNVREGKFIKPNTEVMTIEDLTKIWVIAEIFERQAAWVRKGQKAIATLPFLPGKSWQGKVDYVYPELDQKTHTLRVRLVFSNPDLKLKPKMYAHIKIQSHPIKQALAVPRSALIRTGEGDRVILALGDGRFKARPVKIGVESGKYYQVISGLKENEVVVTSAQFLIDSESSIKASLDRLESGTSELNTQDDKHDRKSN